MAMGEAGYIDSCHDIVSTRITIENALREHPVLCPSLRVLGEPMVSVVAFESVDPVIDVYDIADSMSAKGWHLNALQDPPGIHVAVTRPMVKAVDMLIEDLVTVVEAEKEKAVQRVKEGGIAERPRGQASALYGVAGKVPDKSVVGRLVVAFLDALYKA
jgi:sphinganine-1-phosphate aldolase